MHPTTVLLTLTTLLLPLTTASLGINSRGRGRCHLASWQNKSRERITQVLRDAVWDSPKPNSTTYSNGQHVICVTQFSQLSLTNSLSKGESADGASSEQETSFGLTGAIGGGGICLFPQYMADGAVLDLGSIRELNDAILEHGCGTCGSVPIHEVDEGSNDPKDGILTFNYVGNPDCVGDCISANGQPWINGTVTSSGTQFSRLRRSAKLGTRVEGEGEGVE